MTNLKKLTESLNLVVLTSNETTHLKGGGSIGFVALNNPPPPIKTGGGGIPPELDSLFEVSF